MRRAWSWLACATAAARATHLSPAQRDAFFEDGLVVLGKMLDDAAVAAIEVEYDRFMSGIHAEEMGKDFTDMSKPFGTPFEDWSVVNGMLPHRYHPPLRNNAWERLAAEIAAEVFPGVEMVQDYDQLLDKRPGKGDAVFAMHQDMAYWPPASLTANDTRTVTLTLAIDDETADNGCIRYVPGSQKEKKLRPHRPLHEGREEGHAVVADVGDDEEIRLAEVPRGGVTLHDEWVVHGSPGNASPRHRRTYVIAFRTRAIVEAERAAGFTHSHNDDVNWDVFNPEIAAAAREEL
jgi:ectoine hydroxylase-related dioxygenase (phytanoyl-CoA dioxygenase family)